MNGHAFCCFARRERAWIRCSATMDLFGVSLVAHPMVGVLSLNSELFVLKGATNRFHGEP